MKFRYVVFVLLILAMAGGLYASSPANGMKVSLAVHKGPLDQNMIDGIVWDPNRRPVPDMYVELANAVDGDLGRTRTTGSGHFTFFGLTTGRFKVKVVTAGTTYMEAEQDVEILGSYRDSRETRYVDFYLKYDARKVGQDILGAPDAIFVQDIPADAKKLYKKGVGNITKDEGLAQVEQAITAYPEYFDALVAAGRRYFERGEYVKAAPYLVRAIRVNPRSYTAYSALAYTAYKLKMMPEAMAAAQEAVNLRPEAVNSRVFLGRLLRMKGDLKGAEEQLLKAKKAAPDSPNVCYELALLYNKQNRNAEAAAELAIYLKSMPDAENRKEVEDLIAKLKTSSNK